MAEPIQPIALMTVQQGNDFVELDIDDYELPTINLLDAQFVIDAQTTEFIVTYVRSCDAIFNSIHNELKLLKNTLAYNGALCQQAGIYPTEKLIIDFQAPAPATEQRPPAQLQMLTLPKPDVYANFGPSPLSESPEPAQTAPPASTGASFPPKRPTDHFEDFDAPPDEPETATRQIDMDELLRELQRSTESLKRQLKPVPKAPVPAKPVAKAPVPKAPVSAKSVPLAPPVSAKPVSTVTPLQHYGYGADMDIRPLSYLYYSTAKQTSPKTTPQVETTITVPAPPPATVSFSAGKALLGSSGTRKKHIPSGYK